MRVDVVVPYGGDCPYRARAWEWVASRYADRHPSWRVVRAHGQPGGAWCKGKALWPALQQTQADIVILGDADCWTEGLAEAVEQVAAGAAWCIPHGLVKRLTDAATTALLAGEHLEEYTQKPYVGIPGGGFVVAPREVILSIPLDPRFVGWG